MFTIDQIIQTCRTLGEMRYVHKIWLRKSNGKKPLERPSSRWEDNTTMDLRIRRVSDSGLDLSVGFEVLTEVVMKSSIFWVITPCSPLNVNTRFGQVILRPYKAGDMFFRNFCLISTDYMALCGFIRFMIMSSRRYPVNTVMNLQYIKTDTKFLD
jgi:hypothetical protein